MRQINQLGDDLRQQDGGFLARMRCLAWRLGDLIKEAFSWSGEGRRIAQKTSGTSYYGIPLERENEGPGDSQKM